MFSRLFRFSSTSQDDEEDGSSDEEQSNSSEEIQSICSDEEEQSICSDEEQSISGSTIFVSPHTKISQQEDEEMTDFYSLEKGNTSNCETEFLDCCNPSSLQEESKVERIPVKGSDFVRAIDFDSPSTPTENFSCKGDNFVEDFNGGTVAAAADNVQEDEEVEEIIVNEFDSPSVDYSKDVDVDSLPRAENLSSKDDSLVEDVNGGSMAGGAVIDMNEDGRGDGSSEFSDCACLSEDQVCPGGDDLLEDKDCLSLSEHQVQENEEVEQIHVNEFDSPSPNYSKDVDVDSPPRTLVKDVDGGSVAGGTDSDTNDGRSDGSSECSDCLCLSEDQEERMLVVESRESKDAMQISENFVDSPILESSSDNCQVLDKFERSSVKIRNSESSPRSFLRGDSPITNKSNAASTSSGRKIIDLSLKLEGLSIKVEKSKKEKNDIEKSTSEEVLIVISDDEDDSGLISSSSESSSLSEDAAYSGDQHVPSSRFTYTRAERSQDLEDEEPFVLNGESSKFILPGRVARMLYPHQTSGLRWLWSLHSQGKGGILGDDMGLGKTMQMCSFIAGLFHSRLIKRVLVVAPKTLLSHWIKELTVVGLSAKIREYYGSSTKARQYELQYIFQDSGILLTTYDIVRNNYKSLRGDSYFLDDGSEDCITWDYTILDEGHIIKNPSTQRAKSLLEIPCSHRIIISGTPIQNNLKELWALFSFCCPELLGDKQEFKLKYESAILRLNDKSATDREKRIGSSVAQNLRARIEPYFLRRLKSEVFLEDDATQTSKISKKHELIVWLKLTQCQRQLYEAFLNSELVLSSFDKLPLAAITILKKICDHPYLLTKRAAEEVLEGMGTMVNQEELGILEKMAQQLANATDREHLQYLSDNVSCKIAFILPLLDNLILEGHHVLIFSQTQKMLNIVQEAIISKGYNFLRIDGTTKMSDREKIVKDFQEGKGAPIFLLTSAVGGLGLTLTKADRVIVVDPAWNPSTDNQSVDRAYRIGQMKDVIVYRLMTCGTIEEKIYKMQVFKGGLFKTATENKEQTKYFSQQDLRELFSLPKEGFDVSVTQRQLEEEHGQHNTMSDSLKEEIEFLESHDIGGVSHHSLLFSKTAPAPAPIPEENEALSEVIDLDEISGKLQRVHV
ncbi:DNA helicase [Ranunculus cassubicifolius]